MNRSTFIKCIVLFFVCFAGMDNSTADPDGVALAAIQELVKQNQNLRKQLASLQAQVQTLMAGDKKAQMEEK
jgi:hypothetical protein